MALVDANGKPSSAIVEILIRDWCIVARSTRLPPRRGFCVVRRHGLALWILSLEGSGCWSHTS